MRRTGMMARTAAVMSIVGGLAMAAAAQASLPPGSPAPTNPAPADSVPSSPAPANSVPADPSLIDAVRQAVDAAPPGCDPLDTTRCLLPFPSDTFTTAADTTTGRTVTLPQAGMPVNASGTAIDATEWGFSDGFSPNAPLLTYLDGLDATASKLPPWTDLGSSLAPDASVVLVDITSGQRVPLWAEIDAHAVAPTDRLLKIQPAVTLDEGHRFAVGLRGMRRADGTPIEPGAAFRAYRDNVDTGIVSVEARRSDMEAAFQALAAQGVRRDELTLAWTFTTASTDSTVSRMLAIRDRALAPLADTAPAFEVTRVIRTGDEGAEAGIALSVEGTFTVTNFLDNDGSPGGRFTFEPDDTWHRTPMPNPATPTLQAPFVCNISDATMAATEPAHLVLYGHGLLGDNHEINAGNVRDFANEHNVVFCATKWAGMSNDDIPHAITVLGDWSTFNTVADRLQQGLVNQMVLGRLMTRAGGLGDNPHFRRADGTPLIDTAHLDYDGNSQGAIMGLALTAVSPDIERSVLGVATMNYSLLLPRSVDFDVYEAVFQPAYPNDLDRVLILSLVQMLWDRAEGAGYVHHVTSDPLPGSKTTPVLVHVAFGDWQVSELASYVQARTMGIPVHRPVVAPGRSAERDPVWNVPAIVYPSSGSGLVVWDSGSDPIPFDDVPPNTGRDPHEDPRADADVRRQKAAFLFDDTLIDVCNAQPCTADQRL